MNLYEYCANKNLDISMLSEKSLDALGGMFLEFINPTQEYIDTFAEIDSGKHTTKEALSKVITQHQE